MEAHYAAAKTGLVGLSNVIAIEGAAHGILSNTVLPTGFSRMVTETVGDEKFLAESGFMRAIRAELVVPLVVFLASRACDFTHRNYSACAGRYARVFMGLSEGWLADAESEPTAEDIHAHLDEVSATEKFIVPDSIVDEVLDVCDRLGISAMPDNAEVSFPNPKVGRITTVQEAGRSAKRGGPTGKKRPGAGKLAAGSDPPSVDATRRTEILKTANTVIATTGLRSSLQQIADAAGILAGSLYHHFESKEAILVELIGLYHADLDRIGEIALDQLDEADPRTVSEQITALGAARSPRCAVRASRGPADVLLRGSAATTPSSSS